MPRALITGITGQDGWYLHELLQGKGYEVVGLVRPRLGLGDTGRRRDGERRSRGRRSRCAPRCSRPRPTSCTTSPRRRSCPPPGRTRRARSSSSRARRRRCCRPRARSRACACSSPARARSSARPDVSPQNEQTPMRPRSPYGVAKLAAYGFVDTLRHKHGMHASCAIAYNHESPRRPERFLPRKVSRGAAAIKLGLQDELALGDLRAVRDWCHARDVVRGYWLMLQHDEPGDYVLASGVGRTVGELVEAAFAVVGIDPQQHVRVDERHGPSVRAHAADRRQHARSGAPGMDAGNELRGDDRGDGAGRSQRAQRRAALATLRESWPSESLDWAMSAYPSLSRSPPRAATSWPSTSIVARSTRCAPGSPTSRTSPTTCSPRRRRGSRRRRASPR